MRVLELSLFSYSLDSRHYMEPTLTQSGVSGAKKMRHYIVYMGHHSHPDSESVITANHEMLAQVLGSFDGATEASVHHYTKSFRGFSAMLTPQEAKTLADTGSVVSVFESRMNKVHTTRTWSFLGIDSIQQYNQLPMESQSDTIVGIIDSGIWPESESFNDYGLGPVRRKFKGECVTGENFTISNCNRKIIGARFYWKGFEAENGPLELMNRTFFRSARDGDGHGTHTASTAAGSKVVNASLLGMAKGTARGGATTARLAIYKACWFDLCSDADILSAMDDAIEDGVDILSMSLGPTPPQPLYFEDAISIGSYHAFQKGILVSASAGNSGLPGTATNVAPWILTVAASTIDREFTSYISLGNSKILKGSGLNTSGSKSYYGLITGSDAAASQILSPKASFCDSNTLDPALIKGKIVVCAIEKVTDERTEKALTIRQGGGVGMILIDPLAKDVGFQYVIPGASIDQEEALELRAYMATEKPQAMIHRTATLVLTKPAPEMAVFSSMGPNVITPDTIKVGFTNRVLPPSQNECPNLLLIKNKFRHSFGTEPDITGPGVNILAAWSPVATEHTGEQSVNYNIISGTSMSCPHITAVAAIIKSCHPYWSPAAIKSAIITTATVSDNTGNLLGRDPDGADTTPFSYGAGHINPVAAVDPGLIYDFGPNDVIDFLCSLGASPAQLQKLTSEIVDCNKALKPTHDFNYPSIGVSNMNGRLSVQRTVTYYGKNPTVYAAKLEYPNGVNVSATPHELKFTKTGEKMTFKIDFAPYKSSNGSFVFGALTWSNGIHRVRSPIGLNILSV